MKDATLIMLAATIFGLLAQGCLLGNV